jgi:hypothetical protein
MCLAETCSRVWVSKNLSDVFPIGNGLRQGDALSPLLLIFPRRRWEDNIKMDLQEVGGGCGDWMERLRTGTGGGYL